MKRIVEFINAFGHHKMQIKSDNEGAAKNLRDETIAHRQQPIILAGPVPPHPRAHGIAEDGVLHSMKQLRNVKLGMEKRMQTHVSVEAPIDGRPNAQPTSLIATQLAMMEKHLMNEFAT